MTVEEMRKAINDHCDKVNDCSSCHMYDSEYCKHYYAGDCPEDILKDWYKLLRSDDFFDNPSHDTMNDVIQKYCDEQSYHCDDCAIDGICSSICGCFDGNYDKCKEAYEIIQGLSKNNSANNPYWERITEISNRQREKGIRTYGQGLEQFVIPDALKRIEYIQEELIDGLMYLEWLKDIFEGRH